jgi:hypothetical protein
MVPDSAALLAAGGGIARELINTAGAVAAAIALLGLIAVLPLYLAQRREVRRLLDWQEREPEAGEAGQLTAYRAAPATGAHPATGSHPATGTGLTPAERVTLDRPALKRITAERAAIESPSFWRRLIARGPRHPLVLALLALLAAGAVVATVAILARNDLEGRSKGADLDRASVSVVVLNGSSQASLENKLADTIAAAGFAQVRTGTGVPTDKTTVLFAERQQRGAKVVARELNIDKTKALDRATGAMAPDADVVVVAGEDRAGG